MPEFVQEQHGEQRAHQERCHHSAARCGAERGERAALVNVLTRTGRVQFHEPIRRAERRFALGGMIRLRSSAVGTYANLLAIRSDQVLSHDKTREGSELVIPDTAPPHEST